MERNKKPDNVCLVHQNGVPYFIKDGYGKNPNHIGKTLVLSFGAFYFGGDVDVPLVSFILDRVNDQGKWIIVVDENTLYAEFFTDEEYHNAMDQKPVVMDLVMKLNQAIENGQDYDLEDYLNNWEYFDATFSTGVYDSRK